MNKEGSKNMRTVMEVNTWSGPWIKDCSEIKNSSNREYGVSKFDG